MNNGLQVLSVSLNIFNAISFFSDWLHGLIGKRGGGVSIYYFDQLRVISCIVKYNRSVEILKLNVLNNFCAA